MSQYRLSVKIISRAKGQSAVAAAAYQAGERLKCERDGKIKSYGRQERVLEKGIILPKNAPERLSDRETLWNEIEKIEKGNNARLARSFELSLQRELTLEQNKAALEEFIEKNFTSQGIIVDYAIHDQNYKKVVIEDTGEIELVGNGNIHAHLKVVDRGIDENGNWLPKQRKIYLDKNGNALDPADKENRVYDKTKRSYKCRTEKLTNLDSKEALQNWRKSWQDIQNAALNKAGLDIKVDCRTLEAQGIDRTPQRHAGYNEEIKNENKQVTALEQEIKKLKGEVENERVAERTERARRKRARRRQSNKVYKSQQVVDRERAGELAPGLERERPGLQNVQKVGLDAAKKSVGIDRVVSGNNEIYVDKHGAGRAPAEQLPVGRDVARERSSSRRIIPQQQDPLERMQAWTKIQPVWEMDLDRQLFYARSQEKLWQAAERDLEDYLKERYNIEFSRFKQDRINAAVEQGRIKINAEFDKLSQDYKKRLAEYNKMLKEIEKLDGELVKKQGFFNSLFGDKKERESMEKQLETMLKQQKAEQADLLNVKKRLNSRSEALKESDEGIYAKMKKDFENGFSKRYSDVREAISQTKQATEDFKKINDEHFLSVFRASENEALMKRYGTTAQEFMKAHYHDIVAKADKKPRANIGKALKNLRITNRGRYLKGLVKGAKNSRALSKTLFKRGKDLMKAVKQAVKAVGQVLATIVAACFGKAGGGGGAGAGKAAATKDNLLSNDNTSLFKSKFDDDDKETQQENISEGRLENQNKWDKIEEQKSKGDQDSQEPELNSGVGSAELDRSDPLSRLDEWEWLSDLEKEDLEDEMARRKG